MVNNKYSMDDLENEIFKCRVLCKYCHIFHTKYQTEQGILYPDMV